MNLESPFVTVALAVGIALVALVRGHFGPALWIALLLLVLLGAALPIAGAFTGGLVLFYLLFVHGRELIGDVTNRTLGATTA